MNDGLMTIEELSIRSGVSSRNIRAYQSRGLLPAPQSQPGARLGFYDSNHLGRLRLINRLQERGFSLAGIADLLDALEAGRSLEQVLGMEAAVAESEEDESEIVSEAELLASLPADMDAQDLLQRLRGLGLVVRDGQSYRVKHPAVLAMGKDARQAGIPYDLLLEEFERVQQDAHRIAHRFVALYNDHIWLPYMAAGMPKERLPLMVDTMKKLRKMAVAMTAPLMSEAIMDEIEVIAQQNLPTPDPTHSDRYGTKKNEAD